LDIEKYRRLFVEEATDHLAEMARALSALEQREGGNSEGAIDTLFRMAHSIKGMASSLDYESVASLAHRLEDWLEPCREAGLLPEDSLSLVYEVMGALEQMVAAVDETGEPPPERADILRKLLEPIDLSAPAREAGVAKKGLSSLLLLCPDPSGCAPRRSIASWLRLVS
jgi:two-component system chemotaxis sensor kinase CheA